MIDRDWMMQAACRNHDPELMFPPPADRKAKIAAQRICADCPVKTECHAYAQKTHPTHGVWAGEYLNERNFTSGASQLLNPCGTSAGFARHRRNRQPPCRPCKQAEARRNQEFRARKGQA